MKKLLNNHNHYLWGCVTFRLLTKWYWQLHEAGGLYKKVRILTRAEGLTVLTGAILPMAWMASTSGTTSKSSPSLEHNLEMSLWNMAHPRVDHGREGHTAYFLNKRSRTQCSVFSNLLMDWPLLLKTE